MATFRWRGKASDQLFSKEVAGYMAMCIALVTDCTAMIVPWPEDHLDSKDFKDVYLVYVFESEVDGELIGQLSNTSAVREWIRNRILYEQQQQLGNPKGSQS